VQAYLQRSTDSSDQCRLVEDNALGCVGGVMIVAMVWIFRTVRCTLPLSSARAKSLRTQSQYTAYLVDD